MLRAGGDPNVFFAQQSMLNTPVFQPGLLSIAPGLASFNNSPSLLSTLGLLPGWFPSYTPAFIDSLSRLVTAPATPAPTPAFLPSHRPGTCSVGDPYQSTFITFIHRASRPVAVYLVNDQCQEVFFNILLPGATYFQLTFVGQTWSFRDAITRAPLLGEPQYTIPDTNPQFYTIFDVAGQQSGATAQPSATNPLEGLKSRYAAIAQSQQNHYYSDPELAKLRIELYQHAQTRLNTDPLYLYWNTQLKQKQASIRSALPSYQALAALNQEISILGHCARRQRPAQGSLCQTLATAAAPGAARR